MEFQLFGEDAANGGHGRGDWLHQLFFAAGLNLSHSAELLLLATIALAAMVVMAFRTHRWYTRALLLRQEVAEISERQRTLQLVAENASDGLLLQEMDATILWANPAYCRIMGWPLEEIIGRKPQEYCFPPELRPPDAEIAAFAYDPDTPEFNALERRLNIRKDGTRFWHEFNLALVEPSPGHRNVVLVSRDITEQVERESELERARAKLHHAATHDALTGLANRSAFLRYTQSLLDDPDPVNRAPGILHIDLDRFKTVNDARGHAAGDRVLEHVAQAIRESIRDGDLGCRIGGDEFAVVCPGLSDFDALQSLARRLIGSVGHPISWQGEELACTASVGIAVGTGGVETADELLRNADFALYEAKKSGRPSIACYDSRLHARHEVETGLIEELARALDSDGLEFHFQPLYDTAEKRCVGFETLARWTTEGGIQIPPPRFVEFAGRLGRKADVDFAAMRAAVDLLGELVVQGHDIRASFNATTESLSRPDFMAQLDWEMDRVSVDRCRIIVEVLETTFFGPETAENQAAASIARLRRNGYNVVLDDFGVGYAGLAHLDKLDITGIKIDRSLVMRAAGERTSLMIVTSVLRLAEELGLKALAEGIETREQAKTMIDCGCTLMQGHAISKPLPRAEFIAWLQRTNLREMPESESRAG